MTQAATRSVPRNAGEENLTKEQMAARIDDIVDALFSTSSGTTAPASPALGMQWLDTSSAPYRLKLWDGVQWAVLGAFNPATGRFEPYTALSGGSARPAGATAGTPWLKTNTTPWVLYVFDGADDIALLSINATTNAATVPAGSLAVAALAASALVKAADGIENFDTDTRLPTAAAIIDYVAANASGLGVGQTWQNFTGVRTHSTSYQNTTGKPIAVSWSGTGVVRNFEVSVDGSTWVKASDNTAAGNAFAVVPNGHYYRVNGSVALTYWLELR